MAGDPSRILVISLRRIGDLLLTTPLIRSLRRAWPNAEIDVLVFANTAGIVAGNPDINRVIAMPPRPTLAQSAELCMRLWRQYDIAVSTQSGDRPTAFAFAAARLPRRRYDRRRSLARARAERLRLQKSFLPRKKFTVSSRCCALPMSSTFRASRNWWVLRPPRFRTSSLAAILPWSTQRRCSPTRSGHRMVAGNRGRARPTRPAGRRNRRTRRSRAALPRRSLERRTRLIHQVEWPEIMHLLKRARVYIGPDTSVTHLPQPPVAARSPLRPHRPARLGTLAGRWTAMPWDASGTVQNQGNVWIVQNPLPCMPCSFEGCDAISAAAARASTN